MIAVLYNPLEEYEKRLRSLHIENATKHLEMLVKQSGVDIEKNRQTVALYCQYKENLVKLRRKLTWLKVLRVLMCITLVLIPLVILKTTPKIKALKEEIAEADKRAEELLAEAHNQMRPLNTLFTDRDALHLIESVMPLVSFDERLSVKQEADMRINYDFQETNEDEESTLDVLAGHYNENPFLFENKLIHRMGTETYHGYKTIHWTETYRGSDGKTHTRTRSQTLHATVTKPKPFYHTQVVLNYCAQGGPELSFSRDATHLERKNERQIERYIKKGERKLKKKTDKAIAKNQDFMSMSNSEFEVLFDALDRTDEVQFRTLFTPLAQTNMVDLLLSQVGYGDDFHFIKRRRTNQIITNHSQGRAINLLAKHYMSYSYDIIKENFIEKNKAFFKAVYFDFAPALAIPAYQERPVHSLKPIPEYGQLHSVKECEALSNSVDRSHMVHPHTKTEAILKTAFASTGKDADEITTTAYSYDIAKRVDVVSVHGGDGKFHSVPVEWDEYLPLEAINHFLVAAGSVEKTGTVLARRNGLCIFKI